MKPLTYPDNLHFRAAQGWLGLGLPLEADKELDEITPELRIRPDVLLLRYEVYFQAKKWECVVTLADTLLKTLPKERRVWVNRSYALHELRRTQEAFDHLRSVAKTFPKVWVIPYNLACYTAQLGRLDESREWLKKAMTIDERTVKRKAMDDPDLKPLWVNMSGTLWERTDV